MERAEFLRKQAERLLALAQECADPKVQGKLVDMANEYIELMNTANLAPPEDKAGRPD
jgi:hypothetical protein